MSNNAPVTNSMFLRVLIGNFFTKIKSQTKSGKIGFSNERIITQQAIILITFLNSILYHTFGVK